MNLRFFTALFLLCSMWLTAQAQPNVVGLFCPPASTLKKNPVKLTWSADNNNYRSYDTSFASHIDKFIGAQWVGANVGQITCVYQAFPKGSFPILLIFHTLALEPTKGDWGPNKGGYRNCNALDPKSCPYQVRLQQKQDNIYQDAEKLKSNAPYFQPPSE